MNRGMILIAHIIADEGESLKIRQLENLRSLL